MELTCIIIFTLDYCLRVFTVHAASALECGISLRRELKLPWLNKPIQFDLPITVVYCSQWLNLIDFLAIVPFYIEVLGGGGSGASVLRVLRLVRIFRVLKMPKLRACAEMFIQVVCDALPALSMLFVMTAMMCILFASLIVFSEGTAYSVDDQWVLEPTGKYKYGAYVRPTAFGYGEEVSPFRSIAYAFWWFFTTVTTVGYGDDYPTTALGRCVGVVTFYSGIILFTLPVTVVGGCFNNYYPQWVKDFVERAEVSYDLAQGICASGSGDSSVLAGSGDRQIEEGQLLNVPDVAAGASLTTAGKAWA